MYLADGIGVKSSFGGLIFQVPRSRDGELVVVSIKKLAVVSIKRKSFENQT